MEPTGTTIGRVWRRLGENLRRARTKRVSRRQGFALLLVMVTVAMLGAVVGEFGYNARVELSAASNARDQLRAEYLARSGINLTRLLIKVQTSVLDPLNNQMKMDIQIADFAPYLMAAFGGGEDERQGIGAMLGIDTSTVKGLGVGRGESFDVVMGTEDGKININCGGGLATVVPLSAQNQGATTSSLTSVNGTPALTNFTPPTALYTLLTALMFPPRYNRFFEAAASDGQYYTRDEVARAIIDWSDIDEQHFDPFQASGANEDYRYDQRQDPYRAHNNYYDTTEEVHLVRGVGDEVWGSFGSMFTVYGSCKVNLRAITQENWPITSAIIRAAAQNPQDPALLDDNVVAAIAQNLSSLAMFPGMLGSVQDYGSAISNGGSPQIPDALKQQLSALGMGSASDTGSLLPIPFPQVAGVVIDQKKLAQIATIGPRQVYSLESTGTVSQGPKKKIQVRIHAIFDTQHFNQNTTSGDVNDRVGTWLYWRLE